MVKQNIKSPGFKCGQKKKKVLPQPPTANPTHTHPFFKANPFLSLFILLSSSLELTLLSVVKFMWLWCLVTMILVLLFDSSQLKINGISISRNERESTSSPNNG